MYNKFLLYKEEMILKKLEVLAWPGHKTNCYIIADEVTKEAMVVDPGNEANKIIDMINILGVKVKYIVLTHCHADHVMAVPELKEKLRWYGCCEPC